MNSITYQELNKDLISLNLLSNFNRYQVVSRCWRKESNKWVLKDISFIEDWNTDKKHDVTMELLKCINSNGFVFGAFLENKLIGFASLISTFFGRNNKYLEMTYMHVSYEYRGKGIGRQLFNLIIESARYMGAKKIYISAHSSEESQAFYKAIGCVDAKEINEIISQNEPCDCQMEYVL